MDSNNTTISEPTLTSLSPAHVNRDHVDHLHRAVTKQMQENITVQSELLKSIQVFRNCSEQMAQASDAIANAVSKTALVTMTSHQTLKEFRRLRGETVSDEEDVKQKKLSAALQQIVKFQTLLSNQQQLVSNALSLEFERPILLNTEKYRQVSATWSRDYEKEMRKLQSEIKAKENESVKMGKKKAGPEKLSQTLYELSAMMTDLNKTKLDRMESALLIDRHQHLLVAHHLQQVLKAEVLCHKNVYYQQNSAVPVTLSRQPETLSRPVYTLATPASKSTPSLSREVIESPPTTPLAPPRRVSSDETSKIASKKDSRDQEEEQRVHRKNSSFFGSPLPSSSRLAKMSVQEESQIQAPSRKSSRFETLQVTDATESESVDAAVSQQLSKPRTPQNPHRKTLAFPENTPAPTVDDLRAHLGINVQNDSEDPYDDSQFNTSALHSNRPSTYFPRGDYDSELSPRTASPVTPAAFSISSATDEQEEDSDVKDWIVCVYDYEAQSPDDLTVYENDVLRVIALEDEWVYALLLEEFDGGYIPAQKEGRHQSGWVPRSFTEAY